MKPISSNKTISSVIWSAVDRFSGQGILFLTTIVMTRLLSPAEYGIIGILNIILALSQTIIECGFVNALVWKKDRTEFDFSSVFYFNVFISSVLYLILFFSAESISVFFEKDLTIPIQIISINVILISLSVVHRSLIMIHLDFKKQTKATIFGVMSGSLVGVVLAYYNFGIWALISQSIVSALVTTLVLLYLTKWYPREKFSWLHFDSLFKYGSKLLLSGILDTIYRSLYTIIIGKRFEPQQLGHFSRAESFAQLPSSNLTGILNRVTFSILTKHQDDLSTLRILYKKYICFTGYIIFPLMVLFAALAKPFILLFLTDKWLDMVPLLQILCLTMMWYPVHSMSLNLLQARGRTDIYLKIELIKKVIGIIIIGISTLYSVKIICWGILINSFIALFINTWFTGKEIQITLFDHLSGLFKLAFLAISMGVIVYLIIEINFHVVLQLLVGSIVGLVYYLSVSYFLNLKEFDELKTLVRWKK